MKGGGGGGLMEGGEMFEYPLWQLPHVFRHFLVRTFTLRHLPLESFFAHLFDPFLSKHVG